MVSNLQMHLSHIKYTGTNSAPVLPSVMIAASFSGYFAEVITWHVPASSKEVFIKEVPISIPCNTILRLNYLLIYFFKVKKPRLENQGVFLNKLLMLMKQKKLFIFNIPGFAKAPPDLFQIAE